jgi:transcriptional regulator with XRE-family HTH domain
MAQTNKIGGSITVLPNGKTLTQLREAMGLRQHQIEAASGIPPGRLTRYERGFPIPLDHLDLLIQYYGVSARYLTQPDSVAVTIGLAARIAQLFDGKLEVGGEAVALDS